MKPLNKLEKEMFESIKEYVQSADKYGFELDSMLEYIAGEASKSAAKVAVDLAKRAWDGATDWNYPDRVFTEFLKSEGIETEK